MIKSIKLDIISQAKDVCSIIQKAGFEAYIVGGIIRDKILNKIETKKKQKDLFKITSDYDITTNALPSDIVKLFKKVIPTGIKHGTVTVIYQGANIEITTYRIDGDYTDYRHPNNVIFGTSLEEDLKRRDFTINALAFDPNKEQLIDIFDGLSDLTKRIIRAIGDPVARFSEDALRMIRMCRFAALLNAQVEKKTLKAVEPVLENINKISAERIRIELLKMMKAEKPSIGFELMRITGILKLILPELDECFGIEQNKYHKYDIYYHSIYSCDAGPIDHPLIRLAALFHDIGKKQTKLFKSKKNEPVFYNHEMVSARITKKILIRLRFSKKEIKLITRLIQLHMFHYTSEWTDGAVRRFIKKTESIRDELFLLRAADRLGSGKKGSNSVAIENLKNRINKIIEAENAVSIKDLDINGTIIMEKFKLQPGPIIGRTLNHLLDIILDNPELNNKDTLLKIASKYIEEHKKNIN